ncbi:uncharacterized protein LAESUDRAFT_87887 [Laetiporus sulphureus 93-53]|uniref:Uncharacterized protein n=1 Tax=Laetiporus sulphureus 93-53 TaxID=1314785 RepID=A0A165EWC0_9APHY|nr:uncharacterized protein LAESUDRAFT_87887 [Laetiporus sulphureus 93-53]KZT07905.1 hypothetical protein LAESUDRAFT_87887 [Laetiporus sulphureus 93-53]
MSSLQFSWSDSLHAALSSCFICFHSSDSESGHDSAQNAHSTRNSALIHTMPPPRARPDELEGLLADSDSADAETLSLHSNPGERRRRKRRRARKGIRLFGFDLFGRPPIQLPETDDEEDNLLRSRRRSRTVSSSTLDSDASPLDPSVLDEASVARLAAATAAAEEEQRRAREERRKLKKERKELKRLAQAMALDMHGAGEESFQGFQGSGPGRVPYEASDPTSGSGSASLAGSHFIEEFGPFAQAEPEEPEDDADFGAEDYTRAAPNAATAGGSASDSRSRTSASNSNSNTGSSRHHHYHFSQGSAPILPALSSEPSDRKKKRKSTRSKSLSSKLSEAHSHSSASATQSPSIPSPPPEQPTFDLPAIAASHETDGQFEGFPGGTLDLAREQANAQEGAKAASGPFPSVGLRGIQRTKSDMGVFLARRGEE